MLESVTGTNGILIPPDGYMQGVRALCDRHGILLIADEVMAGFGRTGRWFAIDHSGVVPDMITTAKALGAGFPGGAPEETRSGLRLVRIGRNRPDYYARLPARARAMLREGSFDLLVENLCKLVFASPAWARGVPGLGLVHHLFGTSAFRQVALPTALAVLAWNSLCRRIQLRETLGEGEELVDNKELVTTRESLAAARDRAIAEDAAIAGRAVKAVVGEVLAGDEAPCLIGPHFLGLGRNHADKTGQQDRTMLELDRHPPLHC